MSIAYDASFTRAQGFHIDFHVFTSAGIGEHDAPRRCPIYVATNLKGSVNAFLNSFALFVIVRNDDLEMANDGAHLPEG
jgi:hypothetical protein